MQTGGPDLRIVALSVANSCFPTVEGELPNAPRVYRNGIHEGLDFYASFACTAIGLGIPVLAAKDSVIIRADSVYQKLTTERFFEMEARGFARPDDLDILRGRQV